MRSASRARSTRRSMPHGTRARSGPGSSDSPGRPRPSVTIRSSNPFPARGAIEPMAFGTFLKPALASLAPSAFMYRGPHRASGVSITFDDGPDPRHTQGLLDALEGEGAKGTFFLQGSNAEKHPSLVRE